MILTKVLEKKGVIQFFGVVLILTVPISFLITKILLMNDSGRAWADVSLWMIMVTTPLPLKILDLANVVIGLRFLSGSKSAWKYTLILLLCYIGLQLANITENYRTNRFSIFYPIINALVFVFIADQLVYKVKTKLPAAKLADKQGLKDLGLQTVCANIDLKLNLGPSSDLSTIPTPILNSNPTPHPVPILNSNLTLHPVPIRNSNLNPSLNINTITSGLILNSSQKKNQTKKLSPIQTRKRIIFHFEGIGSWAQLKTVTNKGLHLRKLLPPPQDIYEREIKLSLKTGFNLRVRLTKHLGDDYFFEYSNLSAKELAQLNTWLKSHTVAA